MENPDKWLHSQVKKKTGELLKREGYIVTKAGRNTVFFGERQHAQRISFRERDKAVIRAFENRRSITYPLDDKQKTLERIERFFIKRKPNQFMTFRVGDKSPFNIAITSLADFNKYVNKLESTWRGRADHPGPYLQIVEVTDYDEEDEDE